MAGLEDGIDVPDEEDPPVKTAQQLRKERGTEQSRHTKAYNSVVAKIRKGCDKADLEQCRDKLTAIQLSCFEAHTRLVTAPDYVADPADNFLRHINDTTQQAFVYIDEYLHKLDYRQPEELVVTRDLDTGEIHTNFQNIRVDKSSALRRTPTDDSTSQLGAKPRRLTFGADTSHWAGQTMTDTGQSVAGVPIVEQLQSMLLEQAELFQRDRTRRDENEKFYRETIERQQRLNDSVLTRLLDRLDKVEGQHSTPDLSAIANKINRSSQGRKELRQTQSQHPPSSNQNPFSNDDVEDDDVVSEDCGPTTARIDSSRWSFNASNPTRVSPAGQQSRSIFRLPKIDLEHFNGEPKNWPTFIANFRDLVHRDDSLTNVQKMAVLRKCLAPSIQQSLGDCLNDPELYGAALDELESSYGHPHLVSRTYIRTIINLPKVSSATDYKGLFSFSNAIRGSVASLKNGGYAKELEAGSLLEIALDKLPPELQSKWGRKIIKSHL